MALSIKTSYLDKWDTPKHSVSAFILSPGSTSMPYRNASASE